MWSSPNYTWKTITWTSILHFYPIFRPQAKLKGPVLGPNSNYLSLKRSIEGSISFLGPISPELQTFKNTLSGLILYILYVLCRQLPVIQFQVQWTPQVNRSIGSKVLGPIIKLGHPKRG